MRFPLILAAAAILIAPFVFINNFHPKGFLSQIINSGPRTSKNIALTFDADMTPKMQARLRSGEIKSYYDKKIVDILEAQKIPATFFITGMWAETYPNGVKEISEQDFFEIGNHSYDHAAFKTPCFKLAAAKDKTAEVTKTQSIIKNLTGQTPQYFRFPGGCYSNADVQLVENLGLKVVEWDVVSGDAFSKDEYRIENSIETGVKGGSIIVMHLSGGPNAPDTSTILPSVINNLKKKGFTFVKLSDLLK